MKKLLVDGHQLPKGRVTIDINKGSLNADFKRGYPKRISSAPTLCKIKTGKSYFLFQSSTIHVTHTSRSLVK